MSDPLAWKTRVHRFYAVPDREGKTHSWSNQICVDCHVEIGVKALATDPCPGPLVLPSEKTPHVVMYGHEFPHQAAFIVGDRAGLRALREAIDEALASGDIGACEPFTTDGEGYTLRVALQEPLHGDLFVPYTDSSYAHLRDERGNLVAPEGMIGPQETGFEAKAMIFVRSGKSRSD